MTDPFESLRHDAESTGSTAIDPRFRAELLAEARRRLSATASAPSRGRAIAETPASIPTEIIPMREPDRERTRPLLLAAACLALIACGAVAVIAIQDDDDDDDAPAGTATGPSRSTVHSSPSSNAVAATTTSPTATSAGPAPRCDHGEPLPFVTAWSFPADGPDLRGRIFFGQLATVPDKLGQIVERVHAIDPDGSDLVQVLDCKIQRPRVSPDGTTLAFSIAMDDDTLQIATANVDGSGLRILTSTTGFAETPDWSPDGSWLVYSLTSQPCLRDSWEDCVFEDGLRQSLWRIDADGGNRRRIGEPDTVDWEPRLSPDGRHVVLSRNDLESGLRMGLVIRDLDTGQERVRVDADLNLLNPDWSPDGKWIIYTSSCGIDCERVERVPANNLEAEPDVLYGVDDGQRGYKPAYSADGSQIVFGCERRLCVMNADGSNPQILVNIASLNHFDWGVSPT